MEWSIQEIARSAGTTSRTLRHYGDLGLLVPSRVAANGYRYYDERSLVRLQQILLLRELGLGLPAIGDVLAGEQDEAQALRNHLELLQQERRRLGRQIESVKTTLRKIEEGEQLMAEEVFEGFNHAQYEEEVTERWGRDAWEKGDRWWKSLTEEDKKAFRKQHDDIARDWGAARTAGEAADGEVAQAIAARQVAWMQSGGMVEVTREYVSCIGDLFVGDPRYGENYDKYAAGTSGLVRDALKVYAERSMS
ncbi:MerR family transcriptional regulator [Streptomyces sp. A7024]|uniref:MerR family transcriptional regulator n=1 Tax=Streptomyces coryli TaxID=1128680 RepID=A0A6G4TVC2_9ACTN|nr:MerR family transcriptional regulator [Streptomyces coryli]NGN63470.1 MerR family transcriptional regulator [Streptomyces coryli]